MTGMGEWETAKRDTDPMPGAKASVCFHHKRIQSRRRGDGMIGREERGETYRR